MPLLKRLLRKLDNFSNGLHLQKMNDKPCAVFIEINEQWLANMYEEDFVTFMMLAVTIVQDTQVAEDIVGNHFAQFAREFAGKSNIFPTGAHAMAHFIKSIRDDCFTWLHINRPENVSEEARALMDDFGLVQEIERITGLRKYAAAQRSATGGSNGSGDSIV